MRNRLYNISAGLFIFWAIGFFALNFGSLVHVLFLIALILFLYQHFVDRQLTL